VTQTELFPRRAAVVALPPPAPRKGSFTSLASGRQFWPLDPHPEEIHLDDIARALSMQCRWGGHVRQFFSVAQHCVMVSEHSPMYPVRALLHDAAEAYLVDVPTPIKKHLAGYEEIERRLLRAIGERFGVAGLDYMPPAVHEADARALATEHRDVRTPCGFWTPDARPWDERIWAWSPAEAEGLFLMRAERLGLK
jgi:hypothetical protein